MLDLDPVRAARRAGLHYVDVRGPGITRRRSGTGYSYVDPDRGALRDPATLSRIRALAIPPAWTDVWISRDPDGHVQATGRDARGRKQYRYHARWREIRDETKYTRLIAFANALPRVRTRLEQDLATRGLTRAKVLAVVVALLDRTQLRVGNEEYTRQNRSFGLTTLRNRHANIHGAHVELRFRGKSGIERAVGIDDRRLARIVRRCQELPGEHLFQYVDDDGKLHHVGSSDVNEYLRETTGEDFTAKDFRTWAATVLAAVALRDSGEADTTRATKQQIVAAVKHTAERLGNTPAVCRKCYIHPGVLELHARGERLPATTTTDHTPDASGLGPDERAVVAWLERSASRERTERARDGLLAPLRASLARVEARTGRKRSGGTRRSTKARSGRTATSRNATIAGVSR